MAGKNLAVAGVDIGATNTRAGLFTPDGRLINIQYGNTVPNDYEGSLGWVIDALDEQASSRNLRLATATIAVAAQVRDGQLTLAEDLTPWLGRFPGRDLAHGLNLATDVKVVNDMVGIAASQVGINNDNSRKKIDRVVDGAVVTLSSGFNSALYFADGKVVEREDGHEHLKGGAICGCGADGHVGAHISGNGWANNHGGVPLAEGLRNPDVREQYTTDLTTAIIRMIEKHRKDHGHFAEELRWTGGVALGNQDLVFLTVNAAVRDAFGDTAPAFDMVTMGDSAGVHGAAVDAQNRLCKP